MPWITNGAPLDERINVDAAGEACARIARAGGQAMHEHTVRNTPVGDGKRRPPGTLRESIERGPVVRTLTITGHSAYSVKVSTDDPIAPYVEWNTRPHNIPGAFGRPYPFGIGGRFKGLFHPGTTGQHMFAIGAHMAADLAPSLARPVQQAFAQEVIR